MGRKCLFINDREPYPEDCFHDIDGIEVSWRQDHSGGFSLDQALASAPDTQILITTLFDLDAARLRRLPALEMILTITTSTDFIDKDYCASHGIRVLNTPGFTGASVAEHAMALMLTAAKRLLDFNREIRGGDFRIFQYQGMELVGKTAGIIGMGTIGSQVASMLQGFGMSVLFHNRNPRHSELGRQVDLDTLLRASDVLFLTLSLNPDSRQLLNAEALARLKPGAILVNISPDGLIDFDALRQALEDGVIAYAGLDIHHQDPRFLQLPNTVLSPRRAWYTHEAFERRIRAFTHTLANYLQNP